nr:translation initiation factor IF-2-like [Aegilops tauschii subsp. strangulata]
MAEMAWDAAEAGTEAGEPGEDSGGEAAAEGAADGWGADQDPESADTASPADPENTGDPESTGVEPPDPKSTDIASEKTGVEPPDPKNTSVAEERGEEARGRLEGGASEGEAGERDRSQKQAMCPKNRQRGTGHPCGSPTRGGHPAPGTEDTRRGPGGRSDAGRWQGAPLALLTQGPPPVPTRHLPAPSGRTIESRRGQGSPVAVGLGPGPGAGRGISRAWTGHRGRGGLRRREGQWGAEGLAEGGRHRPTDTALSGRGAGVRPSKGAGPAAGGSRGGHEKGRVGTGAGVASGESRRVGAGARVATGERG